ncbi:DUF2515 family protein [Paenibacillus sp. FSL R5-0527]|uniref:DUF2515 family protein n=1 Tax=Paenibacillus sp. FSL R5-0527 TaxID=2975321 RepID=UPI00404842EE
MSSQPRRHNALPESAKKLINRLPAIVKSLVKNKTAQFADSSRMREEALALDWNESAARTVIADIEDMLRRGVTSRPAEKPFWSPEDLALAEEIAAETSRAGVSNITRTAAYLACYEAYPELHWAFLAHMVSRNAGWNMTDLSGSRMADIIDAEEIRLNYRFLERNNALIFQDAYPQLLLYMKSRERGASHFHLLPYFHVSRFMRPFWERFWIDRGSALLTVGLIINEQNYIEKRVVRHPYFQKYVTGKTKFHLFSLAGLNQVVFPLLEREEGGNGGWNGGAAETAGTASGAQEGGPVAAPAAAGAKAGLARGETAEEGPGPDAEAAEGAAEGAAAACGAKEAGTVACETAEESLEPDAGATEGAAAVRGAKEAGTVQGEIAEESLEPDAGATEGAAAVRGAKEAGTVQGEIAGENLGQVAGAAEGAAAVRGAKEAGTVQGEIAGENLGQVAGAAEGAAAARGAKEAGTVQGEIAGENLGQVAGAAEGAAAVRGAKAEASRGEGDGEAGNTALRGSGAGGATSGGAGANTSAAGYGTDAGGEGGAAAYCSNAGEGAPQARCSGGDSAEGAALPGRAGAGSGAAEAQGAAPQPGPVAGWEVRRLAGRVVSDFGSLPARIALGKSLYAMLMGYRAVRCGAERFAASVPHSGSRADYWPGLFTANKEEALTAARQGSELLQSETLPAGERLYSPKLLSAWGDTPYEPISREDWLKDHSALNGISAPKRPFLCDISREHRSGILETALLHDALGDS